MSNNINIKINITKCLVSYLCKGDVSSSVCNAIALRCHQHLFFLIPVCNKAKIVLIKFHNDLQFWCHCRLNNFVGKIQRVLFVLLFLFYLFIVCFIYLFFYLLVLLWVFSWGGRGDNALNRLNIVLFETGTNSTMII